MMSLFIRCSAKFLLDAPIHLPYFLFAYCVIARFFPRQARQAPPALPELLPPSSMFCCQIVFLRYRDVLLIADADAALHKRAFFAMRRSYTYSPTEPHAFDFAIPAHARYALVICLEVSRAARTITL